MNNEKVLRTTGEKTLLTFGIISAILLVICMVQTIMIFVGWTNSLLKSSELKEIIRRSDVIENYDENNIDDDLRVYVDRSLLADDFDIVTDFGFGADKEIRLETDGKLLHRVYISGNMWWLLFLPISVMGCVGFFLGYGLTRSSHKRRVRESMQLKNDCQTSSL